MQWRPLIQIYTEGLSRFVTSVTAPVASGWSGWSAGLHPLESAALSRRTRHRSVAVIPLRARNRLHPKAEACVGVPRCLGDRASPSFLGHPTLHESSSP